MEIGKIKRDVEAIETGGWVGDIPNLGDIRLQVRGIGSKLYNAKLARLSRSLSKEDRDRAGIPTTEAATRIAGEAMVGTILLGWDNIVDDGVEVPYSDAQALAWLTNPEYETFMEGVTYAANVIENSSKALKEAVTKN